jgi:hypothetical protein
MRLLVCAEAELRLTNRSRIEAQTLTIRRMRTPRMGWSFYKGYEADCPTGGIGKHCATPGMRPSYA